MTFNSFAFVVFFIFVFLLYFFLPFRLRNSFLLAASFFFYMYWSPGYAVLLLSVCLVCHLAALEMDRRPDNTAAKKHLLILCCAASFGLLFVFKYFNFFMNSFESMTALAGRKVLAPDLRVLLPVGISFYTFQAIGYAADVYGGKIKAERSFLKMSAFISFFPQLVAGPIERASNLLPQFNRRAAFSRERFTEGMKLVVFGFFKKMCVADNLGFIVERYYNAYRYSTGPEMMFATYLFAFQIYCDFSGYTDIARGCAKMLGFDLMQNFNLPYFSPNPAEFWRRWHISLSTWLRDYLYIPLGGNRRGGLNTHRNLMITMLLGGLWHGANWTFVFWGFFHGVFLVAARFTRRVGLGPVQDIRIISAAINSVRIFITFNLVSFAWIFFRSGNISQAFSIIGNIASDVSRPLEILSTFASIIHSNIYPLLPLAVLVAVEIIHHNFGFRRLVNRLPFPARCLVYLAGVMMILMFGVYQETQFIYFQF